MAVSMKVCCFFSTSNPLVYRLKMAHEIKDINKRFDKVADQRNICWPAYQHWQWYTCCACEGNYSFTCSSWTPLWRGFLLSITTTKRPYNDGSKPTSLKVKTFDDGSINNRLKKRYPSKMVFYLKTILERYPFKIVF